ncbi:MAG: aldehyde dehydrogenase family protein, partial [Actinomycetota bacterium]|nr:aldehyde dehydrogenase family protein [Actinomycetota bacterium]
AARPAQLRRRQLRRGRRRAHERSGRPLHRRGLRAGADLDARGRLDRAYAAASEAFQTWRDTTPGERQRALLRFADAVEARADEIVALESQNTGKPIATHRGGGASSDGRPDPVLRRGGARARGPRGGRVHDRAHPFVRREPVGVVGQVTPWNYP